EEVVVGQTQRTLTTTDRTGSPLLAALHIDPMNERSNQTTSYEDRKEWRIYFQAKGTEPATTDPSPAPPMPSFADFDLVRRRGIRENSEPAQAELWRVPLPGPNWLGSSDQPSFT